jgi:hypothetical protein
MDKIRDLFHVEARMSETAKQMIRGMLQHVWQPRSEYRMDTQGHEHCTCGNVLLIFKTI